MFVVFKRKNSMSFLGALLFVCIVLSIVLFGLPIWKVNQITITGNEHYTQEEIMSQGEVFPGMHILQFHKKGCVEKLKKLPYIDTVTVNIYGLNTIELTIVEKTPIGYVPFSGTYLCIDKNGQVIDQKDPEKAVNVPVIEGLKFEKFIVGEILEVENEDGIIAIIEMTMLMEKYNLLDQTVRIDVADPSEIHLYIDTLDVIIGEMKDIDKKIQWLCKIIEQYDMGVLDLSHISNGQAIMSPLT